MSTSMAGLPDEVLESTFIKGLKPEIRAEVRVLAREVGPNYGDDPIS